MPIPEFHRYDKKVERAAKAVDTDPTDAQREAGNHRVGKVFIHGFEISLTNPKGSTRTGTSPDGKKWSREMKSHYGYINRTTSTDGEHVDVFLGDHPASQLVFVISQLTPQGEFDEHKAVMATRNLAEAKKAYLDNYPSNWAETRLGEIRGMTTQQFKEWMKREKFLKSAAGSYWLYSLPEREERIVQ